MLASLLIRPANARTLTYEVRDGRRQVVVQNQKVLCSPGDRVRLDFDQGFVFCRRDGVVDFPILVNNNGGAQTVLRIFPGGAVIARVRKFTSPTSFFRMADFSGNSVLSRGTEIYSEVSEDGTLRMGVREGSAWAISRKETQLVNVGFGAIATEGTVTVFPVDFKMQITQFSQASSSLDRLRVKGCVTPGNAVYAGDRELTLDGDFCFDERTTEKNLTVINLLGVGRTYRLITRPFFGS